LVYKVNLDPEEEMMMARLVSLFYRILNYENYNPMSWNKEVFLWDWISKSAGVSRHINLRCFGAGNFEYNPRGEILHLLSTVYLKERERFPDLLQAIIKNCDIFEDHRIEINRYLSSFGIELNIDLEITPISGIMDQREVDRHIMFGYLENYPAELEALKGAIERYAMGGSDSLRQCMDSCRNLIENLIKKLSRANQWTEGLHQLISSSNIRDIYKKTHAYLSSLGVHGSRIPNQKDAELGLKMTEDIIVWLLKDR